MADYTSAHTGVQIDAAVTNVNNSGLTGSGGNATFTGMITGTQSIADFSVVFTNSNVSGSGVRIQAGSGASQTALLVEDKDGNDLLLINGAGDTTFSGDVSISNSNDRPLFALKDSSGFARAEIYIGDIASGDADEDATYIDTKGESLQVIGGLGVTGNATFSGDVDISSGFIRQALGAEVTISSGVVTVTQGAHYVDTQSDAASDDLATINGGTAGDYLLLRMAVGGRTVVVKDGVGNIFNGGGGDISLSSTADRVLLHFDGSSWCVVGVSA